MRCLAVPTFQPFVRVVRSSFVLPCSCFVRIQFVQCTLHVTITFRCEYSSMRTLNVRTYTLHDYVYLFVSSPTSTPFSTASAKYYNYVFVMLCHERTQRILKRQTKHSLGQCGEALSSSSSTNTHTQQNAYDFIIWAIIVPNHNNDNKNHLCTLSMCTRLGASLSTRNTFHFFSHSFLFIRSFVFHAK